MELALSFRLLFWSTPSCGASMLQSLGPQRQGWTTALLPKPDEEEDKVYGVIERDLMHSVNSHDRNAVYERETHC